MCALFLSKSYLIRLLAQVILLAGCLSKFFTKLSHAGSESDRIFTLSGSVYTFSFLILYTL